MAVNPDSIPRYAAPTPAELEDIFRDPTPGELLRRCTHEGACLRVMGRLCFNDEAYADKWGKEHEKEMGRWASWMGCGDCDEREDA